MCGFGGIINSNYKHSISEISGIAQKVGYRGPDSCRVILLDESLTPAELVASNHALFFNRLAIVDLNDRSDQPFADSRYILLFNGEIYNYRSLRSQLQKEGIKFKTFSDTEVLFEALKLWGTDVIKCLNGMFSFVFIDSHSGDILLARDRLGIKPMYYSIDTGSFSFASECDSIVRLQRKRIAVDDSVLQSYLWLQYTPTPQTIHRSINKLPPGTFLKYNANGKPNEYALQSYWDAYEQLCHSSNCTESSLKELLTSSLSLQLHADVPVGVFLSSGVDSSLITAIVHHSFARDNKGFNFFTVAFDEDTVSDESYDAQKFIKGFNNPLLEHKFLHVSSSSIFEKAQRMYEVYDEPFADPAALLNWAISEKAREHVTVVLSGDGADELFWGYDRYNLWRKFNHENKRHPFYNTVKGQIQELIKGRYNTVFTHDEMQLHFNLLKTGALNSSNPLFEESFWFHSNKELLQGRQDLPALIDIKSYLPDAMLYKVDRASMAASIEVRVPYLDNNIVNYALKMSFSDKSNSVYNSKALLKELLKQLAPHYNFSQPKKGFSMPLKQWMCGEWKDSIYEVVTTTKWKEFGIEEKMVNSILKAFNEMKSDVTKEVWRLYNFGLWLGTKKSIL